MINKSYFKRFFKESAIFLVVSTIIFSLINFVIAYQNFNTSSVIFEYFTGFIYPIYILLFLGPLYVLNYKDSKRKCDVYYSLPISRTSFLITRISVFLLDSLIIYSVSFFVGIFVSFLDSTSFEKFDYSYIFAFFITSFLTFIPLFFFTTYFANKGNTIVDKIVFMLFYSYGLICIFNCLLTGFKPLFGYEISDIYDYGYPYFSIISPLIYLSYLFHRLLLKSYWEDDQTQYFNELNAEYLPALIIFIVLGIVLAFFLFREEKRDKIERISQISTSVFGYKIIMPYIPFFVFSIFNIESIIGSTLFYMMLIISLALFVTCYFIYKRKFIIQKDAIIYSALFVVSVIIVTLCSI